MKINILGAARLSIEADESTSIERQTTSITEWANLRSRITGDDYHVIRVTEDSGVSGAVSPFDRAGLGDYLKKPLLDSWSVLVVYRLDRLTRSIADFETLWKFLEANGKTLLSIAEEIDFGTPAGRLTARQLVLFAEYERELIRARVKGAWHALQAKGQYAGMQFPFGYIPVKLSGNGWGLEPHPEYGPIVAGMAERVINGNSLRAICRWLDETGTPTPRNTVREYRGKKPLKAAKWDASSVASILRSPTVIGEVTTDGKAVRDESGTTIKRAASLIDRETWDKVKAILTDNAARRGPNVHTSPLLQVAYCDTCGSPLYQTVTKPNAGHRKGYRYYQCVSSIKRRGCVTRRIPSDDLEKIVTEHMTREVGLLEVRETVEIPAVDYSTQMAEQAEAIGALETQIALARAHSHDVGKLETQQHIHRERLTRLAEQQQTHGRQAETRELGSGENWAHRWVRLGWNDRNEQLRKHGIKIWAVKTADGEIRHHGLPTRAEYQSRQNDLG